MCIIGTLGFYWLILVTNPFMANNKCLHLKVYLCGVLLFMSG